MKTPCFHCRIVSEIAKEGATVQFRKDKSSEEGSGMNEGFDLQTYLANGVEKVVTDAIRATLKNPRESAFMLKFAPLEIL